MDIPIDTMRKDEAQEVNKLIEYVISPLTYYTPEARRSEIEKYSPEKLREMIEIDPYSVLIARERNTPVAFCISYYDDGLIGSLVIPGIHNSMISGQIRNARISPDGFFETNA